MTVTDRVTEQMAVFPPPPQSGFYWLLKSTSILSSSFFFFVQRMNMTLYRRRPKRRTYHHRRLHLPYCPIIGCSSCSCLDNWNFKKSVASLPTTMLPPPPADLTCYNTVPRKVTDSTQLRPVFHESPAWFIQVESVEPLKNDVIYCVADTTSLTTYSRHSWKSDKWAKQTTKQN